jgi:ABC-2 type transport system permease protein
MSPAAARAIAGRVLRDGRTRTGSFALLFGLVAYANAAGYASAYPTLKARLGFARSFADNAVFRLFYGVPRDLLTVGGYSAWRIVGFFSIIAAVWGLTASVAALRGEEDAGRTELVLAGPIGRGPAFATTLLAVLAGGCAIWLAMFAGLLASSLPAGESAFAALATLSPAITFLGVGALAAQLAASRRVAVELASALLALALLLRILADTASGLGWLRWLTPLGWTEEMRAFTGARPVVLLLPLAAAGALLALAAGPARRRDIGSGLLRAPDSRRPRLRGLASPLALALREERVSLAIWLSAIAVYGAIVGALSTSLNSTDIPTALQRELHKLGAASITTPAGALGFYFLFFTLAACLFTCGQVAAARREEAEGRLETLLAQPFGRLRWLAGRLVITCGGTAAVALTAGITTWAGAAAAGAGVPLWRMLEAALNCLPVALMFGALGFLAFACAPRAAGGLAYGLVSVAFVWELFGSLLGAPHWIVQATPFQHVALVPAQPFRLAAAAVMIAVALAGGLLALGAFERRDLAGQ